MHVYPLLRLAGLAIAGLLAQATPADNLSTEAERSGFLRTGRYEEVVRLCHAYQRAYPEAVRCQRFGRTPEGRPMLVLVASRTGALSPAEAKRRQLPVLLIQAGIHAGEIDGKDAGFLALRQALAAPASSSPLARQVLLFLPVFNIDGHERFGRWNRPNQRGPEQMGWRTTAQNYDLNRDYAKADSPEMQAMLQLLQTWDPLACVDLHVTDGAKFQHDISVQVEPSHAGDGQLQQAGVALRDGVLASLRQQGALPLPFYMAFRREDDPSSGIEDSVSPPRFSTGYFYLRNRFGMLVETHSWKDYPTRVRLTRIAIEAVLDLVARNGQDWRQTTLAADARASQLAGQAVPLSYAASDKFRVIDFLGYAYSRTRSDVSGALMTRYDETRPQVWKMPLYDDIQPQQLVQAPQAGYLIPAAHAAWVAAKLSLHGIGFQHLAQDQPAASVQAFRASEARLDAGSSEGHQRLTVAGQWRAERRDIPAGSLFVPIAQAKARLVMALLEPSAPDSLLAWGQFNNAFEQKEYMEDYVAEEVAREQLAADPALAAEFRRRLAEDAGFAASPAQRLEFFYRRHSSWDERYQLYPVLRTDLQPTTPLRR